MKLLATTFSKKIEVNEKLERLQQMGIRVTEEIRERMGVMCNLSQGILQEGLELGRVQGRDLTLDILDRREAFPDESLEDTARAVSCTLEDVQAVVNRRKRSWKK